jgi:hypothetical protein
MTTLYEDLESEGPFAFPFYALEHKVMCPGMLLRDYFATHAPIPDASMSLEDHCMYWYAYADAMLEARKPKEPT